MFDPTYDDHYTVRRTGEFKHEMTKWSRGEPEITYKLEEASWARCTCPSRKTPCKHEDLVQSIKWMSNENLMCLAFTYDTKLKRWTSHKLEDL